MQKINNGSFVDAVGRPCQIRLFHINPEELWLGVSENRMRISRELAAELSRMLGIFAALGGPVDLAGEGQWHEKDIERSQKEMIEEING